MTNVTRELRVAYPVLAALYAVLALAAANGGELTRGGQLARPVAITLLMAGGFWLLAGLASRDPHRRGIVTFVAVVVFSTYGYYQALLLDVPPLARFAHDAVAFPAALTMIVATAWSARRARRDYTGVTRFLNLLMSILVLGALVGLAHTGHRSAVVPVPPDPASVSPPAPIQFSSSWAADRPHVFIIVPDKYTGSRSLRANFGYDNAPFEQALEDRGFVVARHARANYIQTSLALAAMLNWDYVSQLAPGIPPDETRRELLYPLIENNRTVRALKSLHYRFVFFPTAFGVTAANRLADVELPEAGIAAHEFEAAWVRTTMLYPLLTGWCGACTGGLVWNVHESARSIEWKFEQLERLASSAEPVFVLAHLPVPHEPYLFDAECRPTRPYWPFADGGANAQAVKAAYISQIECVNRRLLRVVTTIVQHSSRPAVIVLQSDHGHGRFGLNPPPATRLAPDNIAERLDILAAYHLPGAPRGLIHDSIGSVNAMRAIMRHYLGLALPPLPEASYWSSASRPYEFTRLR